MDKKLEIRRFYPPKFDKKPLNNEWLTNYFGRPLEYASTGKSSLYHILKSLNCKDYILVPNYICGSVLKPIKKCNLVPVFYDIDIEDLNPSIESIDYFYSKYSCKTLLAASMYGNPANMTEIEQYCKDKGIILIDDAAQSFGATLSGKNIGTFGDAGFFSFSPGKPVVAHMGSFFWTSNNEYRFDRTRHYLIHKLAYMNFYINRVKVYSFGNIFKAFQYINPILCKIFDISNDQICEFENEILGGVLHAHFNGQFNFRREYYSKFIGNLKVNSLVRVINSIRGESNPHKIVLKARDKETAQNFISFMTENKIFVGNGYSLLANDLSYLPNSKKIDGTIIELPIEDSYGRMDYLFNKVEEFIVEGEK